MKEKIKKILKIISIVILLFIIIYFGIYFIQNKTLTNSFVKETNTILDNETKFIRCNWNIFEPEFAFVFDGGLNDAHMSFRKSKKMFYQDKLNWRKNKIGGTTISNTTFDNLLKMVKEDCYQFQKDSKDLKNPPKEISWGYREYDRKAEEQKKLQEELMLKKMGIEKMYKYKATEENIKKLEKVMREKNIPENKIKSLILEFKDQGELEIEVDLSKVKL